MPSSLVLLAALAVVAPAQDPYSRVRLDQYLPPMTDSSRSWEESRAFIQSGGNDALGWTPPIVDMLAGEDLSRTSVSLAFGWTWLTDDQGRHPVWFARLRAMNGQKTIERFADSRRCPAIEESVEQIRRLPPISPRVPTLPPVSGPVNLTDMSGGYMHDNGYRIRMRGLFDGAAYSDRLEVSGGSSSPIAPVVVESLERLKPCWSDTPPPLR